LTGLRCLGQCAHHCLSRVASIDYRTVRFSTDDKKQ
jgi:hypothetical protein